MPSYYSAAGLGWKFLIATLALLKEAIAKRMMEKKMEESEVATPDTDTETEKDTDTGKKKGLGRSH